MHRVLKPGGMLGLIWNSRDESLKWVARMSAIIEPYEGDAPRFHSGSWRAAFPAPGFAPLEEQRFRNDHVGPPETVVIDRLLSTSFIAALPAMERERVAAELRAFIAATPELAGRNEVTVPYLTYAFSTKRL
jgi:SAM-dependent methyltransferase